MRKRSRHYIALLPLSALGLTILTGCGGAGTGQNLNTPTLQPRSQDFNGGPGATNNGPSQRLNLFLTEADPETAKIEVPPTPKADAKDVAEVKPVETPKDSPNEVKPLADAHLYVTLHKVEIIDNKEQAETVFEDAVGRTFDLKSLRDAKGARYLLLSRVPVTPGRSAKQIRLTFGKTFQRFPKGDETATSAPLADSIGRDAEGRPVMTVGLAKARDLGTGKETLVLALTAFTSSAESGRVVPYVREVKSDTLKDPARQERTELAGAVSEVAGGGLEQSFTLTEGVGRTISVQVSPATVVTNADDTPNPALGQAKKAVVSGTLDVATGRVIASRVTLYAAADAGNDLARVQGVVSDVAKDGSTFVLSAGQIANLNPTQSAVTVRVTEDVARRSVGGLILSADALTKALTASGTLAEVEGTYEPATATLTARRVQLVEKQTAKSREAQLAGVPGEAKVEDKSFTLSGMFEWDGLSVPTGDKNGVPVVATLGTAYTDADGKVLNTADFFAAVKKGDSAVRVTGLLAEGKLTATRLELRPLPVAATATKTEVATDKGEKTDTKEAKTGK